MCDGIDQRPRHSLRGEEREVAVLPPLGHEDDVVDADPDRDEHQRGEGKSDERREEEKQQRSHLSSALTFLCKGIHGIIDRGSGKTRHLPYK